MRVEGIGFFDFFHNQHGVAPNVIELNPVLNITFNPAPTVGDFALSVSSASMHLHDGAFSSLSVTAAPLGGGSLPNIDFSLSGLPAGVTSQVASANNGKSNLTLTAKSNAVNGTFPIIITGTAKGRSHSQTIALNVSSAPGPDDQRQWEYKMISAVSEQAILDQANELGAQDWEMVGVTRVTSAQAWRAFFKRQKKD